MDGEEPPILVQNLLKKKISSAKIDDLRGGGGRGKAVGERTSEGTIRARPGLIENRGQANGERKRT